MLRPAHIHRLAAALALVLTPLAAAAQERLAIVADIAPTASLVRMALGEGADVTTLIDSGADPHHAQIRPSAARALTSADLVVWVGPSLTPSLAAPITQLAGDARMVELQAAPGITTLAPRAGAALDGHDHSASIDPHLWLDPQNAAAAVSAIAAAAPDQSNPATLAAALETIAVAAREAEATLVAAGRPRYVAQHDALAYFEAAFDLSPLGAVTGSDAARAGAGRLAQLNAALPQGGVCLVVETGYGADAARALGDGREVRRVVIDPLGQQMTPGASLYPDLLTGLADAIAGCAD